MKTTKLCYSTNSPTPGRRRHDITPFSNTLGQSGYRAQSTNSPTPGRRTHEITPFSNTLGQSGYRAQSTNSPTPGRRRHEFTPSSNVLGQNGYKEVHTFPRGICIYQIHLCTIWMWHKVNSKWNLIDFNLELSFYQTSCHTKVKQYRLPFYLCIAGRRTVGCLIFPGVLACNLIQDFNLGLCDHFLRR